MPATLSISGVSASVFGLVLGSAPSWLDTPVRSFTTVAIPGRLGVTPLSDASEAVKTLSMKATVIGTSPDDARDKLDALKVALRTGTLTLTFADRPNRMIYADLLSLVVTPPDGGSFIASQLALTLSLQCSDPLWYDTTYSSVTVASGSTQPIPLGTGPVRPLMTLQGPSTNPLISLVDHLDDLHQEMIFNGLALNSGDALVISSDAMTIQLNGANAIETLTAGDFLILEASEIADFRASQWPVIGLTGGGVLSVQYQRTWR